jgi:hypothetical protein
MDSSGFGFQLFSLSYSTLPSIQEFYRDNLAGFMEQEIDFTQFAPVNMTSFETLDSSSFVEGIGFGAFDLPAFPGIQVYADLDKIKTAHLQEQAKFSQETYKAAEDKKNLVFNQYHYEFDADGKPVLDKNGNPQIFEGKETPEQSELRKNWEKQVIDDITKRQQKEQKTLSDESSRVINELYSDFSSAFDPEKSSLLREQFNEISSQEKEMIKRHESEIRRATCAHLPDPGKSGSTIGDFLDGKIVEYTEIITRHEQVESNSEPAMIINNYIMEVEEFSKNQMEKLEAYNQQYSFDPDAMKNFMKNLGFNNF